jgi:hypothetical protein
VELTVGRHAAGEGVGVDPIVAAALGRRPTASAGLPRHGQESRRPASNATGGDDGGLGWPGEPADGSGLGWPDGLLAAPPAGAGDQLTAVPPCEAPVRRRSGWRRLFGGASGERGTSAA